MPDNFGPIGPQQPQQYVPKPSTPKQINNATKEATRINKEIRKWPKQESVAKGFGKITTLVNNTIHNIREKINDVYYGKTTTNPQSKHVNPLDYGLINVLNLLLEVDICSIFSYALNKLPGTPPFDPNDKANASKTTLGSIKWQVQNVAYEINKVIDDYYTTYADVNSADTKIGLYALIQNLNNKLSTIRELMFSEALLNSFPELNVMDNFLGNAQKYFAKYTDPNSLNNETVKDILEFIQKTKTTCSLIMSLNNPTALLQFSDSVFGTSLMDQIKKLDKVINPKNLPKAIKNIADATKKIQDMSNKILQYINYARFIVSIATILIVVLKFINKFLKVLGVPSIFTFLGLSTTMAEANGAVIDRTDYYLNRLREINTVLNSIYNLCQDLTIKIQSLIDGIKRLIQNILDCQDSDTSSLSDSINDLNNAVKTLESIKDQLNDFIFTYDGNKKKKDNTFGNYTIEILTEELTDEGIARKRRYGVALDYNRAIIVQSTPTFASDDRVIIEEVKLLLISKNLVKTIPSSAASLEELRVMEEALSYLPNSDISLDDMMMSFDKVSDEPDNENEDDDELGTDALNINAFVNKLKGGKKLRRRMRLKMAAQKTELADSLKKTDKGGKFTSNLVKSKTIDAINDQIKAKQEEISIYNDAIKKYNILIATNPTLAPAYVPLIRKKNKQIKDAEAKIKSLQRDLASIK
jgi:hypothetical protein